MHNLRPNLHLLPPPKPLLKLLHLQKILAQPIGRKMIPVVHDVIDKDGPSGAAADAVEFEVDFFQCKIRGEVGFWEKGERGK